MRIDLYTTTEISKTSVNRAQGELTGIDMEMGLQDT